MKWIFENVILPIILKNEEVKKMLTMVKTYLAGKKTYLTGIGMIITALIMYSADGDAGKLINAVLEAFALMFIRAGVSKVA